MRQVREDGRTGALLPDTRGPKPGMQPLDPAVEAIVSRHFREFYAARRKAGLSWEETGGHFSQASAPCARSRS